MDQVLLDEPGLCFPDPADVAVTPDGRLALVTSSSSDRVAVVDVNKLIGMLERATPEERERIFPNHLGKPTEFVLGHIATGISPRGIVISADGEFAYTANALDDSLTVIDIARRAPVQRIDLGGPKVITKTRYGERIFNNAKNAFHRQFSCHTCHPDGHVDGLTYDTMPDGIGNGPVDNRTLRGILDTSPFKWEGSNPSLSRQCGARLAVYFTKVQPFTPEEIDGAGGVHLHDSPPAEPLPPARGAAHPGAASRQGDVRTDHDQRRPHDPEGKAMRLVPLSAALYRPADRTTWARRCGSTLWASSTSRT